MSPDLQTYIKFTNLNKKIMEEKSKKTILLREQVIWSLIEKFSEEMISKGVNLEELKNVASFLEVLMLKRC